MQIVIIFSDIDLNDWIDGYDSELPKLKDVFKDEIIAKFVEKLNYDYQIREYVKDKINDGLWKKIYEFKNDSAIEVIVKECIEEKLKSSGSFIFLKEYASKVESVVDTYLKNYSKDIESAVKSSLKCQIAKCIDELYKGSKMREFIDYEKLIRHVHDILSDEMIGDVK